MEEEKEKKNLVKKAYDLLAEKRQNWPNKYNINFQISKFLCDYTLLSKVDLLGKKVLNVGCSEPIDEIFWVSLVSEWHALDINASAIYVARRMAKEVLSKKLYSKLRFIIGDATDLKLESSIYDVVSAFSTIDHIPGKENRIKAFKEIYRILKSGGYFVVTVPNKWDLKYSYTSKRLQRLGTAIFGYEYQFSPLELKNILIECGFSIIDCASTNFNPRSHLDRFFEKIGLNRILILTGTRFGYLCRK